MRPHLPAPTARTHTLLLTDLVSSTRLAQRLGDARMAELSGAHDRLARRLFGEHGGREIDRTDGFLVLFDAVPAAVGFAMAYHRELAGLGLSARVGIHHGAVFLVENPPDDVRRGAKPLEVEGVAKPVAARVLSVATSGQTLLSASARAALGDTRLYVAPRGHWRLHGLAEPVELFEVGDDRAPFLPPPDGDKGYRVTWTGELWLPTREIRRVLPAERDGFVGRVADLAELDRRFDRGRLVTLLGPGGAGKTRLATRFAWLRLGDFPGGVWFCDLSEARTAEGIAFAVARTLDVPLGRGDPMEQLGHAIGGRGACLLVLDNFEQVAGFAARSVGRWLDRADRARFLVTSRERLGVPGEAAIALPALPVDDGAELFVARAGLVVPDFEPDAADRAAIAKLVRMLDGLPLAIELAAARSALLKPTDLLARMGERFALLSASGRASRHATLRAALDWSWNLLSEDERSALAQLSVFDGGFTLAAAEAVLSLREALPMEALQALIDKSLVRAGGSGATASGRLELLATIQEYAAEKLTEREPVDRRHGAWFARFGSPEALDRLDRRDGGPLRQALAADLDNLAVACRRAVERRDAPIALATLEAACEVLELRGPFSVIPPLAAAVAAVQPAGPARGAALFRGGVAFLLAEDRAPGRDVLEAALAEAGRDEVLADRIAERLCRAELDLPRWEPPPPDDLERLLARARARGDRAAEGRLLSQLALLHEKAGREAEAIRCFEAAITLHRLVGSRRHEGSTMSNLGMLHLDANRFELASALFDAAMPMHREVGNVRSEANVTACLAAIQNARGELDAAIGHYEQAVALHREVGNRGAEGNSVCNLGFALAARGLPDRARPCIESGLAIHRETGNGYSQCIALGHLADFETEAGRYDVAEALLATAAAVAQDTSDLRAEAIVRGHAATLELARGNGEAASTHLRAELRIRLGVGQRVGAAQVLARLDRFAPLDAAGLAEAEAHLVAGRAEATARAVFYGHLGESALWRGDPSGASWLRRALDTLPEQQVRLSTHWRRLLEAAGPAA